MFDEICRVFYKALGRGMRVNLHGVAAIDRRGEKFRLVKNLLFRGGHPD